MFCNNSSITSSSSNIKFNSFIALSILFANFLITSCSCFTNISLKDNILDCTVEPPGEKYLKSSKSPFVEPPVKDSSTAVVVYLDHGWIQVDWDFYEERFVTLAKRIEASELYSDVILSPNYIAHNAHFSISVIFLEMLTRLNENRTRNHLPKINVWIHLRSKKLYELHEEHFTIPFLTNTRVGPTITGLIIEAHVLHTHKEWSWRGLQLYRKAVQSIKPDLQLALLLDRYQCAMMPLKIPKEVILENFDFIYYHDYERRELEEFAYNLVKSDEYASINFYELRTIFMSRLAYEDCHFWLSTIVNAKVKLIQGIYHGIESREFLKFTEIQIVM